MSAAATPDAVSGAPPRRSWSVIVVGLLIVAAVCVYAWWHSEDRLAGNTGEELASLAGVSSVDRSQGQAGAWRYRVMLADGTSVARARAVIEEAAKATSNDRLRARVQVRMGSAEVEVDRPDTAAGQVAGWLVPLSGLDTGTAHVDADSPRVFVSTGEPRAGAGTAAQALHRLEDAGTTAPGVLFAGGEAMPGRVSVAAGKGLPMGSAADALKLLAPVARQDWGLVLTPGQLRLIPPPKSQATQDIVDRVRGLLAPLDDGAGKPLFAKVTVAG